MTPTTPAAPAHPRGIGRIRLAEPVRLYLAAPFVASVLLAVAVTAGPAHWWLVLAAWSVPAAMLAGIECARASVFSPVGAMRERVEAALRARLNR